MPKPKTKPITLTQLRHCFWDNTYACLDIIDALFDLDFPRDAKAYEHLSLNLLLDTTNILYDALDDEVRETLGKKYNWPCGCGKPISSTEPCGYWAHAGLGHSPVMPSNLSRKKLLTVLDDILKVL